MLDDKKKLVLAFAVLGVLLTIAYFPALGADFIWDDEPYVVNNMTLKVPKEGQRLPDGSVAPWYWGLVLMWTEPRTIPQWYPMVHTTFWLEARLWSTDNPVGFHVVNLLLHFCSTILLFLVLRRLKIPAAWAAAAVFCVHPVMVESVAWITERKNVLSLFFYLLSLLAWLRFSPIERGPGPKPKWGFYALSLVLFVCALLSKTVTCSLPAVILLLIYWRRGRIDLKELGLLVPFFAVGLFLALNTAALEQEHVGAKGEEWELTYMERVLVAGRALCFYAGKLAWPDPLVFIYERWNVDAEQAWQFAFPIAWLGLLLGLFLFRGRLGRAPVVAVAIFSGTLVPALGFFAVYPHRYSYVADHFQYHASIALIVLVVAVLSKLPPKLRYGLLGVVLLAFATKTHLQCKKYDGLEVLYESILEDVPDSWFAENNLAVVRVKQGKIDEALQRFRRAKELRPLLDGRNVSPEGYAQVHVGSALVDFGGTAGRRPSQDEQLARLRLAEQFFRRGLKDHPDYILALYNLGATLGRLAGNDLSAYDEPERLLRHAHSLNPEDNESRHNVRSNLVRLCHNKAVLLARANRHAEAQQYRQFVMHLQREQQKK